MARVAAVFVYEITVEADHFKTIKESIGGITADRRLQVLLIAFAFGVVLVITANKLGLSPVLVAAANTAGGVMGKMIDAQSIIVACAATGEENREGDLFRAVHSIALALIVGVIVMLFAYVVPGWVATGHRFR